MLVYKNICTINPPKSKTKEKMTKIEMPSCTHAKNRHPKIFKMVSLYNLLQ